jgi:hypothetical protein
MINGYERLACEKMFTTEDTESTKFGVFSPDTSVSSVISVVNHSSSRDQ